KTVYEGLQKKIESLDPQSKTKLINLVKTINQSNLNVYNEKINLDELLKTYAFFKLNLEYFGEIKKDKLNQLYREHKHIINESYTQASKEQFEKTGYKSNTLLFGNLIEIAINSNNLIRENYQFLESILKPVIDNLNNNTLSELFELDQNQIEISSLFNFANTYDNPETLLLKSDQKDKQEYKKSLEELLESQTGQKPNIKIEETPIIRTNSFDSKEKAIQTLDEKLLNPFRSLVEGKDETQMQIIASQTISPDNPYGRTIKTLIKNIGKTFSKSSDIENIENYYLNVLTQKLEDPQLKNYLEQKLRIKLNSQTIKQEYEVLKNTLTKTFKTIGENTLKQITDKFDGDKLKKKAKGNGIRGWFSTAEAFFNGGENYKPFIQINQIDYKDTNSGQLYGSMVTFEIQTNKGGNEFYLNCPIPLSPGFSDFIYAIKNILKKGKIPQMKFAKLVKKTKEIINLDDTKIANKQ
ncbi:hypothetical protein HN415_08740, partial [Candidatus Woesearchaeota archaeon]|nr:hypothetical protein [Candidatus Woesearchaeota archaeon]